MLHSYILLVKLAPWQLSNHSSLGVPAVTTITIIFASRNHHVTVQQSPNVVASPRTCCPPKILHSTTTKNNKAPSTYLKSKRESHVFYSARTKKSVRSRLGWMPLDKNNLTPNYPSKNLSRNWTNCNHVYSGWIGWRTNGTMSQLWKRWLRWHLGKNWWHCCPKMIQDEK